ISGQACRWGSVGAVKRAPTQRATAGWKPERGITRMYRKFPEVLPADNRSQRGAARRRDALDRLTDLVIGRRGPDLQANGEGPLGQPCLGKVLDFRPSWPEATRPSRGVDAARVLDVEGGDLLLADGGEVRGVARVVAADHHHQIGPAPDELEHRVLALLGGRADRVEVTEVLRQRGLAVALRHALAQLGGDRERFAGQHGGLIRDAHAHEIALRVEPWRHLLPKEPQQPLPATVRESFRAPRSLDVVAHLPRLGHVPDHEVLPARVLGHLARSRLGLLMVGLAVDHGREAVPRVGIDPLPDVQHRAAGRVHEDAADRAQPLEVLHRYPERGEDHHVLRGHGPEVELPFGPAQQNLHAHRGELGVHVGVVDDLANEEHALRGKLGAGLVRVLDRAVDPVAEAEFAGELEREVAHHELVPRAANGIDHATVVVGGERALDRALQPEALAEVGLLHGAQSNGVVPPARTASITRWILQPSSNVAGGTVGAAPSTTRARSRTSRTNERAHIVLGVSFSHSSSGALTSASGPSGFVISSFVSPDSTRVPSLPVTWAKCPGPWWATVVRSIVATAPPVIRSVKLANSSAVARCATPRSSRRSVTKVAAPPATCDGSLPVQ